MAKFLIQASYTIDGIKGLMKDKAAGRTAAVKKAVTGLGGKLESFYWSLGKNDVVIIVDLPDSQSAAALTMAVGASGVARSHSTPLLTAAEMDKAIGKTVKYRAPEK